jgi:hypothetical protein
VNGSDPAEISKPVNGGANGASATKKLSLNALGLLSFEQLIKLLKENEEADNDSNLVTILTRLQALKKISAEKVKETGAGKMVKRLTKHRLREVKDRAAGTMQSWTTLLLQDSSSKDGKSREKEKKDRSSDKERKPDKKSLPATSLKNDKSGKKDSDKKDKKVDEKNNKKEKKHRRDSDSSSASSSGGEVDDYEEFKRKRKKELAKQFAMVEEEEAHSAAVGDTEDDLALLEEIRAAKRAKLRAANAR